MQENIALVQNGFRILLPDMAGYICRELSRVYKNGWWQEVLTALSDQYDLPSSGEYAELQDSLDVANCLRLIDRRWNDVFRSKLSKDYRTWATELMGVRNKVAHLGMQDIAQADAERALDTMARLCDGFDSDGAEEIRALYRKLRYGSEDASTSSAPAKETTPTGKSKTVAAVLGRHVGENLPSWRDVMQPHPDVAEGRYKSAEFAADLAQVARGEGAYEYRDPVEFFARTYVTEGMAGLLVESLQRLNGTGGEPVIQLKTAFGGGKTHSMLALYHIAHSRMSLESVPALKPIMERAGLEEFPHANVAVLVGTALDPSRRKKPANLPGYSVGTIWGEMAYQLVTSAGKPELYAKYIRDADLKGVAPGSENLKNLFNECGPCLILMDELVAYAKVLFGAEGLPAGSFDNFITFIQQITEAARASENSIVVASIPESSIEIGGEAGQKALEAIEHTFGRMESIWKPVAANEGFEVVRRRLFLDCKDEVARDAVCDAFSQMYQDNSEDFPLESKEVEYRDRLVSCYPIHPEVFDRLYGDWATLERFQRTRGVLRLMAAVIHEHQGKDNGDHAGFEHQQKQRDDHQTGDAVGNFQETLHHHIHLAAKVAGDQAVAHADDHIDDGGGNRDDQGHAGTLPGTGPDIAAIGVTAEPVVDILLALFHIGIHCLGTGGGAHFLVTVEDAEVLQHLHAGRKVFLAQLLTGVGILVHAGAKCRQQHDKDNEDQAEHRALFAEEAHPHILPEALCGKVRVHCDLCVVMLEHKVLLVEGMLGIHGIHCADDGISRGFAAQMNRFFCHISRPPLPSGCAGR